MPLAIDRSQYAFAPRLGISSGVTLLAQLVDVARDPELDPSPAILESAGDLTKILGRARAIDDAATLAGATSTAAGDVGLDQRADRTAKAIMLRLQARVLLDDGEPAERAGEHITLLFPEGLAFTKASYAEQDAVMQRMVRQLKKVDGLAESVDELCGPEYLAAFRKHAKAYSTMVKAMGRVVPNTVGQREVIVDMQAAVVQHASRILGELRDADPKSVARTRMLLAPIDNHRARAHTSAARSATPAPAAKPPTAADVDAAAEG